MSGSAFPLPWEQVRWRTRRLGVSDLRLVLLRRGAVEAELALYDVGAISVPPSALERFTGIGTVVIRSTRTEEASLRVHRVWAARRTAMRLALLTSDLRGIPPDEGIARLPLPRGWQVPGSTRLQTALVGPAALLLALGAIVMGLSSRERAVAYAHDDRIRPGGVARSRAEIVEFMEREVMPFAQRALAPVVGAENVRCETCHGDDAEARGWRMPAVQALPEPGVRRMTAAGTDSQIRNALHGYLAEDGNQSIAAHMRGVVVPGMARLLHRPAYDFTQSYEYNRARAAFGCYHCHMVN
jgi:hypothetical protein